MSHSPFAEVGMGQKMQDHVAQLPAWATSHFRWALEGNKTKASPVFHLQTQIPKQSPRWHLGTAAEGVERTAGPALARGL